MSKTVAVTDENFASEVEQHAGVAVVDFWATWCGPCRAALPALHEMSEKFKKDEAPVSIYTVNVFEREKDETKRRAMIDEFWKDAGHSLPVAIDLTDVCGKLFEIPGIPMTVVIRPDGVVHAVHVGFSRAKIEADVLAAIAATEGK
jgi:thiol-disulfide isomerase/thioredoxin